MSRLSSLPGPWLALAEAYGGVAPLAKALGVSPSTVWRWGQGRPISGTGVRAVEAAARRKHVPAPVRGP
jgi:DNA-binding transcriptional regulator YdaS (Cro superfamily)